MRRTLASLAVFLGALTVTTACGGDEGKSTLTITGLEQPGSVDVEGHELEKIIVQPEVR